MVVVMDDNCCDVHVCMYVCVWQAVQSVQIHSIMIQTHAAVILALNAIRHVLQTLSAMITANVCYIFEYINVYFIR